MAELNVQPKKRAPLWPWLLLILIIAGVVYFLMSDKDVVTERSTTDTTDQYRRDTVNEYRTDTIGTDTSAP